MLLGVELESVTPGEPRSPTVDAALESVVECFPELQAALSNSESPVWSGHHTYKLLSHGFTRMKTDQNDQAKRANIDG